MLKRNHLPTTYRYRTKIEGPQSRNPSSKSYSHKKWSPRGDSGTLSAYSMKFLTYSDHVFAATPPDTVSVASCRKRFCIEAEKPRNMFDDGSIHVWKTIQLELKLTNKQASPPTCLSVFWKK